VLVDNFEVDLMGEKDADAEPEKMYIHLLRDPRAVVNA
jgi:hypothetical protein